MPLATAVTNTTVYFKTTSSAKTNKLNQVTAECHSQSLTYCLPQSSQNLGSQPEPTNENSQVSGSFQRHGMMLKYFDDEIMDEEMTELSLQTTDHQLMMESDAQHQTTLISFQEIPPPF